MQIKKGKKNPKGRKWISFLNLLQFKKKERPENPPPQN